MMRRFICGIAGGIAVLFSVGMLSFAGNNNVQIQQITISGKDRGVMFLTFSNNVSVADTINGYGISLNALGPFEVVGTWGLTDKGSITGGYTRFFDFDETSEGTQLSAKILPGGRFFGKAAAHNDAQTLKSPEPGAVPDVSGTWVAKGKADKAAELASFTLTASTNNMPGWFDLTGQGVIGDTGSFNLTGAVLLTSDRHAAAYTVSDFGTATVQASYFGKLAKNGKKMKLVGKDENGNAVILQATTAP